VFFADRSGMQTPMLKLKLQPISDSISTSMLKRKPIFSTLGLIFGLTAYILMASGCSPFGSSSYIEIISHAVIDIFSTKTTTDINSGGSLNLVSAPTSGLASDVHQVNVSVGSVYQQSSYVTAQGHTVEVVISGTRK